MKRLNIIYALILILAVNCTNFRTTSDHSNNQGLNPGRNLELIVNNLVSLVSSTKPGDKAIEGLLRRTVARINSQQLKIAVDYNMPKDIYGGSQFSFKDNGISPTLSVSPYILKIYDHRPSIVYSMLIHEFTHADSFFSNKERFVWVKDNLNEKYLYELDAYHMEGIFINKYIFTNKDFHYTEFEGFLGHSFNDDNLSNFSFSLLSYNMELVFFLNNLANSKMPKHKKFQILTKTVDDILETDLDSPKGAWEKYRAIIPLHTIVVFLAQIVKDIDAYPFTEKSALSAKNFNLQVSHPDFYNKLLTANRIFENHRNSFSYYFVLRNKFAKVE